MPGGGCEILGLISVGEIGKSRDSLADAILKTRYLAISSVKILISLQDLDSLRLQGGLRCMDWWVCA